MYIDTTGDYSMELAGFYENFLAENLDSFAITPEFSQGIPALEAALTEAGGSRQFVKVQTTGPISFGLTIVDENKRAIYYNAEFIDVVVKALAMKCRWQIRKFRPFAQGVICFIDEPILSAFGSSTYVSVTRDDVVAKLGEVKAHIERGGVLAWGIVPTNSAKIQAQTAEALAEKFLALTENLAKASGLDVATIRRQAIVTPSCGTGSLPVADAERVFGVLHDTSAILRAQIA